MNDKIKIGDYGRFSTNMISGKIEEYGILDYYDCDDGFFCKESGKPYQSFEKYDKEIKIMEDYDKILIENEQKLSKRNNRYLNVLKKKLTKYKYNKLIEFLEESGMNFISGIVRKHKVYGKKQEEEYWFKYIYLTQEQYGFDGDSFSGEIFIPIDKKHFLKFCFDC